MAQKILDRQDTGAGHRGIGPENGFDKLKAGMIFVKQIMDDKEEVGEKDGFVKQMKELDPDLEDFVDALLVRCDKVDVISCWTDVTEENKDKLIAELEKDEDFQDFFE